MRLTLAELESEVFHNGSKMEKFLVDQLIEAYSIGTRLDVPTEAFNRALKAFKPTWEGVHYDVK